MKDRLALALPQRPVWALVAGLLIGVLGLAGCGSGVPPADRPPLVRAPLFRGPPVPASQPGGANLPSLLPPRELPPQQRATPLPPLAAQTQPVPMTLPVLERGRSTVPQEVTESLPIPATSSPQTNRLAETRGTENWDGGRRGPSAPVRQPASAETGEESWMPPLISTWEKEIEQAYLSEFRRAFGVDDLPEGLPLLSEGHEVPSPTMEAEKVPTQPASRPMEAAKISTDAASRPMDAADMLAPDMPRADMWTEAPNVPTETVEIPTEPVNMPAEAARMPAEAADVSSPELHDPHDAAPPVIGQEENRHETEQSERRKLSGRPAEPGPSLPVHRTSETPASTRARESRPPQRSRHLELVAREADTHTRRGFELAGRNACFSARAEFTMALRMLSQALDVEHQTGIHSRALATGLTALGEAGDFIPTGSGLEADLDVASIVGGHRTPVLKNAPAESLTPLSALRCYLTYAQEHLAVSVRNEVAGSMALYGLGSLHRALAVDRGSTVRAALPKAIVFYQAALLVRPENHMASNELGVMLARAGRYEDARVALERSLSACQHSAGWYNLGFVYQRLHRTDLAQRAFRQCQALRRAELARRGQQSGTAAENVRWVDPQTFARSHPPSPGALERTASPARTPAWETPPTGPVAEENVARSPWWNLLDRRN